MDSADLLQDEPEAAQRPHDEDEDEDVVGRALSVAGAGTGRCMFIAGFAYYEIGRFDFSVGRDSVYLELMTGAFIMSMVSATISGYVQYYMSGLDEARHQSRFALLLDEVAKGNLVIFVLATLFYCATFARIGYSYYPDAHNDYYFAKHVPILGSVVAFAGITLCIVATVRSRRDLNCAASKARDHVSEDVGVSLGWITSITRRWTGNVAYTGDVDGSPQQSSLKYRTTVESFLQTADAIADRSIFITGFAQSGLARYCPQGPSLDGSYGPKCMMAPTCITEHAILRAATLGGNIDSLPSCGGTNSTCDLLRETCINVSRLATDFYLILITYATVASILAAFVFTILAAAVRELPSNEQATYVWRMGRWRTFAEKAGMSSQIALLVALAVLGFGTSVNHAHVNVENVSVGGTAIAIFFLSYVRVRRAYQAATAPVCSDQSNPIASEDEPRKSTLSSNESRLEMLLNQTVPIGNQATIAAGFTFYNVVTFATDIEGLQNTSEMRKCIFNIVNVTTVAFGVISACLSTLVQTMVTDLKTRHRSGQAVSFEAFLTHIDGTRQVIIYCFTLSLVGFIVGFGIYGITKLQVAADETSENASFNDTESVVLETNNEGAQMEEIREHVLGHGDHIVMYASVVCAGLALFFTACLAFWINSMASMVVDIERVIMMADDSFDHSSLRRKVESSCRKRFAEVTAMLCGCQGIEYLGNNDVGRLNLSIAVMDDTTSETAEEGGQHQLLESMLGTFAFRSLFFGGFAYFAIDFLFTPTWYWSPFYAVAMSLSFCCSVVIITISLLYTVQSGRLETTRMRNLFANKMVWPVRAAYAMFLHALFWQLCGFILIGRVKDFDYSDFSAPDPDIDFQFFFDLATPGLICLVIAVTTRIVVTNKATEISQSKREHSTESVSFANSKRDNCDRMLKRMDAAANSASFCAGNVFYEVLFSGMGTEGAVDFPGDNALWTRLTNHWYFTFSGITFMLGSSVVIISTIVTVWAQALEDSDSKRHFARQMHVLSVACAKLFRYSQYSWLLAVGAMGVVKWSPLPPREQFVWVSVRWSTLGLILMVYYGYRIERLRTKVVDAISFPATAVDERCENPAKGSR